MRGFHLSHSKLAFLIGLVFLSFLPFVGVLDLHHTFAEFDHDGHEHSAFDICQWVQHHANSTLDCFNPLADSVQAPQSPLIVPAISTFSIQHTSPVYAPRPPPISSSITFS